MTKEHQSESLSILFSTTKSVIVLSLVECRKYFSLSSLHFQAEYFKATGYEQHVLQEESLIGSMSGMVQLFNGFAISHVKLLGLYHHPLQEIVSCREYIKQNEDFWHVAAKHMSSPIRMNILLELEAFCTEIWISNFDIYKQSK